MPSPSTLALLAQGQEAQRRNQIAQARGAFEQALAIEPNCLDAHVGLAQLRFPGDHYLTVLSHIHQHVQPKAYVEIGTGDGYSMAQTLPATRRIGIDPSPVLDQKLPRDTELYVVPSNEFFTEYDLAEILERRPLELGFIDGLHTYDQVIDDFINMERFCAPGGTLLMHDCLPLNPLTASRVRQTDFWTGDVWRAVPTLAHFRPDLSISVVSCFPSGLAIIRNLDPMSRKLAKERDEAVRYGADLDFSTSSALAERGIKMLPSDWGLIQRLF